MPPVSVGAQKSLDQMHDMPFNRGVIDVRGRPLQLAGSAARPSFLHTGAKT
jgi:hypothetical protein